VTKRKAAFVLAAFDKRQPSKETFVKYDFYCYLSTRVARFLLVQQTKTGKNMQITMQ
jgi:hypothetical protein